MAVQFNPYLNFDGKCEEAFQFYKKAFGGEFQGGIRYFDSIPGMEVPENEKSRVLHVALSIGEATLMGSDSMPSAGHKLVKGNNNYISISPENREEADRLFQELSAGGRVEMPMEDQFWGDYFGSFIDKYGISWMINFSEK